MSDLYKYRDLAVIMSNHFPFLPISGPGALRCWMLRHLVESLDNLSQLDPSRIRKNSNCQVILLSIILSYCEAATLLHRAYFTPTVAHQIPPTMTYSVSLGFANASCPLHPADLRVWQTRNPSRQPDIWSHLLPLCTVGRKRLHCSTGYLSNCWGKASDSSHWR